MRKLTTGVFQGAFCVALVLVSSACKKDDDDDNIVTPEPQMATAVTVGDVRSEGELKVSGGLKIVGSDLQISIAGIPDPENPSQPVPKDRTEIKVFKRPITAAATPSPSAFYGNGSSSDVFSMALDDSAQQQLVCDVNQGNPDQKTPVDLVFVNDTTGSMSGVVQGLTSSIRKFAQDISQGGIDARFAMFTYGDAFSTHYETPTPGEDWQGDFVSPAGDTVARPYVNLSDLNPFDGFLQKLKLSADLGKGGNDFPENTLGALEYAYKKSTWRNGAVRMFVVTGDNPAHQVETWKAKPGMEKWQPKNGEDVLKMLSGKAIIHGIARDKELPGYFNLKQLAEKGAGTFISLPDTGVVDLTNLNFKEWLTSSSASKCPAPPAGQYEIVVQVTVKSGTKSYTGSIIFVVNAT